MFNLKTGGKEIFPYEYYNSTILANNNKIGVISDALLHIKESEREQFVKNIKSIIGCFILGHASKKSSDIEDKFRMDIYALYYCMRDVKILQEGFETFRRSLLDEFKLDVYNFVSISSIANRLLEQKVYYPNGHLYDLANKPREFISRCILGGRCMLSDNIKSKSTELIVDFDAVSLYPSAMARLYTLEGMPMPVPSEMLSSDYLLSHLFDEGQVKPTADKFISGFFVEIELTKIGVNRHFPLIVKNESGCNYVNELTKMYVDHITLQDLISFQKCEMNILRGYYYHEGRDYTIQNEIQTLFSLRAKYKAEGNTLQEIYKLILNSIYGKTILKPIDTTIKFMKDTDANKYIPRHYNQIEEVESLFKSTFTKIKETKAINKHYNFVSLGVNILSMSKRIMNEIFTIAEENNMKIYYQDTDSIHIHKRDIARLKIMYQVKYNRELIGKNLGQFHSDFPELDKDVETYALKSIFCGKKMYIDCLTNMNQRQAYLCRLKGITPEVIGITANLMYPENKVIYKDGLFFAEKKMVPASIWRLYEDLFAGKEIEFDLCCGSAPCFDMKSNFSITTKSEFKRRIKCI
jgi:hypothetical protein